MKDKLIHNSKQLKDKDMPTRTVKEVKPTPILLIEPVWD